MEIIKKFENDLEKKISLFFNSTEASKNIAKIWKFNDECVVVDFLYNDEKFAFDFISEESGKTSLDLVYRTLPANKKNKKENLAIQQDLVTCLAISLEMANKILKNKTNHLKPEISVIVPVYNRAELILDCLTSLSNQSLSKERFEVIFVDDNSSDKSISSIEFNINKEINYKIIKRTVGSGNASAPRNEGIKNAAGDYIFFLDSDDTIHEDLLLDGINIAKKNDSDIVYFKQASNTGRGIPVRPFKKNVDVADVQKNHLFRSLKIFKLFKTSMLHANNILFMPSITVYEDMIFSCHTLSVAKKISILAEKDYYILNSHDEEHLSKKKFSALDRLFVLQLCFLHITSSDKSQEEISKMYNAWLIICIEITMVIIKKKNVSEEDKYKFFMSLHTLLASYKEYYNIDQIYTLQKPFSPLLLNGDFEGFCELI